MIPVLGYVQFTSLRMHGCWHVCMAVHNFMSFNYLIHNFLQLQGGHDASEMLPVRLKYVFNCSH